MPLIALAGSGAPSSTFCLLYRHVPVTAEDVGVLSLDALRAVETNETIYDKQCRR